MGPRQIWALLAMDQLANPSTRRRREAGTKRLQGLNKPQPCQLAQTRAHHPCQGLMTTTTKPRATAATTAAMTAATTARRADHPHRPLPQNSPRSAKRAGNSNLRTRPRLRRRHQRKSHPQSPRVDNQSGPKRRKNFLSKKGWASDLHPLQSPHRPKDSAGPLHHRHNKIQNQREN